MGPLLHVGGSQRGFSCVARACRRARRPALDVATGASSAERMWCRLRGDACPARAGTPDGRVRDRPFRATSVARAAMVGRQSLTWASPDPDRPRPQALLGGWMKSVARKQPWMWSLTTPTFCMSAYTLVAPRNGSPVLQLLGERVRLWCRRREVCDRSRRTLTGALVGSRERREAGRRGTHRAGVLDGGADLGPVTNDRRILHQPVDVSLRHRRDTRDLKAVEGSVERVSLPKHDRPAEPGLKHTQGERLEQG